MKHVSRIQVALIIWVMLPFVFAAVNALWLEPRNIWPNNDGTGLAGTSVVLGVPIFFLFNIYYLILKPLPIEGGGSGAWLQIVPDTNLLGTILIGGLIFLTLVVLAFRVGRFMNERPWGKYIFFVSVLFLLFDIGNYSLQVYREIQSKPLLDSRAEILQRCNGNGPEYVDCEKQCSDEWSTLATEPTEKRNHFWTSCTARCDVLRTDFQTQCLRESGLPEYERSVAQ